MNCYRCGQPGHFAADCPQAAPAASRDEHLARIDEYVAMWQRGEIAIERKRKMVSDENLLYYGPDCPRRLIWP